MKLNKYIFFCFIFFTSIDLIKSQSCNLNCIGQVNVALKPENNCSVTLSYLDFLTNPTCTTLVLSFELPGTVGFTTTNTLNMSTANTIFKYKVTDTSSKNNINSCWGYVNVNPCNLCQIATPPVINSFTASAGPYIAGGYVTLYVGATDNVKIARVDLLSYYSIVASDYTYPYSFNYQFNPSTAGNYHLKAIVYDDCGSSDTSDVLDFTTLAPTCNDGVQNGNETSIDCGGACINCPGCPGVTNLNVTVVGSNVSLIWNGSATNYQVQIVDVNNNILSTTTTNTNSFYTSLPVGTYAARVRSICGYNYSGWADIYIFVTMGSVCTTPANFGVSTNSGNASFSWNGNAAWYQIEITNTATNNSITTTVGNAYYTASLSNGSYKARVRSECNSSFSSWTDYIYFTIGSSCAIPYNFSVSTGTSSAYFSWTGNAAWYQIEITNTGTNNSTTTTIGDPNFNASLSAGSYKARVRSECNSLFSSWTDYIYFTIGSSCAIPYNFSVSTGNSSAYFSWTGNAAWYQIEITNTGTNNSTTATIGDPNFNAALSAGSYKARVRSECNSLFSAWTSYIYFTIGSSCAIPYNFSVSTGNSSAYFSWTGNAAWYQIEITNTASNSTSTATIGNAYYTAALSAGTYKARVRSECNSLFSDWTDYIYFTIGSYCSVPKDLWVNVNGSHAYVTWAGNAAWYQIEIVNTYTNSLLTATIGTPSYTANLINGEYKVRVRSECGNTVFSSWTNYFYFVINKSNVQPCGRPDRLESNVSADEVFVNWQGEADQYDIEIMDRITNEYMISTQCNNRYYHTRLRNGRYMTHVRNRCNPGYGDWADWNYFDINYVTSDGENCNIVPDHIQITVTKDSLFAQWSKTSGTYQIQIHVLDTLRANQSITGERFSMKLPNYGLGYIRIKTVCGDAGTWSDWYGFNTDLTKGFNRTNATDTTCTTTDDYTISNIKSTSADLQISSPANKNYDLVILDANKNKIYYLAFNDTLIHFVGLRPNTNYSVYYRSRCELGVGDVHLIEFTTADTVQNALSLESRSLNTSFALYPNPARNQLYIQYNSPDQLDFNVQIVNAQGKIVYQQKQLKVNQTNSVNMSTIVPGIYFVMVNGQVKKLIVE